MGKITNTVAAVAAVAAVGGGIALYNSNPPPSPDTPVDDVQAVTVAIPKVTIPTVALPGVAAATVAVPAVNSFRTLSDLELAELDLPEVVTDPVVAPPVTENRIVVPSVADPAERMPQLVAIRRELTELFRDQRNLQYETGLGIDSPYREKWLAIYRDAEFRDYVPEFKELAPGLRIINEVKCPATAEEFQTMQNRLEYYAGRGYNAVLVTFNTTESLPQLLDVADYLKSNNFKVVIAYAGRENLREPVFRDPVRLQKFLVLLGAKADALLLGWRRTSLHLFLPDKQYTNFLIKSARSNNPDLPFIGIAYYGETAEVQRGITYDVPKNSSAVLVVGLGYPGASTKRALQKLFPEIMNHPHKIGLTVGERPYFDTLHPTGKSVAANDAIKRRIEIRLLQAGFQSTMTYSGDGSDGEYGDKSRSENLCREYGTK